MDRFVTSRLTAERLADGDVTDLVALHLDPEVSRFLGGVRSPDATSDYLRDNLAHWDNFGFGVYAIRTHEGAFVGRAGLRFVDVEGTRELEVLYTLARSAWGRGMATELATALVDMWREAMTWPSLVGIVSVGNGASERVLAKSGFTYERPADYRGSPVHLFRQVR